MEQVAFEIEPFASGDGADIDVVGGEFGGGAEEGVHRALAIGRDGDHRAGGGGAVDEGRAEEVDADVLHVGDVGCADGVVGDLAHEGAAAAEAAQARDGVAGRTARGFEAGGGQGVVKQFGARLVDQVGAGLGDVVADEEIIVDLRDHIHDGVAQGDDVVLHRHEINSLGPGGFVGGKPG